MSTFAQDNGILLIREKTSRSKNKFFDTTPQGHDIGEAGWGIEKEVISQKNSTFRISKIRYASMSTPEGRIRIKIITVKDG